MYMAGGSNACLGALSYGAPNDCCSSPPAVLRAGAVEHAVRNAEVELVAGGLPTEAIEFGDAGHSDERADERGDVVRHRGKRCP